MVIAGVNPQQRCVPDFTVTTFQVPSLFNVLTEQATRR